MADILQTLVRALTVAAGTTLFGVATFAANASEFALHRKSEARQERPAVAGLTDGTFVSVWQCYTQLSYDICARRFDSTGAALGRTFRVNRDRVGIRGFPGVANCSGNGLVIFWEGPTIRARRTDINGRSVGRELILATTGDQVSVSCSQDGSLVAAWVERSNTAPFSVVFAQKFTKDGVSAGPKISVDSGALGSQEEPSVALAYDGTFVVTWERDDTGTVGPNRNDQIVLRRFLADGSAAGPVQEVGLEGAVVDYEDARLAMYRDGDFVVSWIAYDNLSGYEGAINWRLYSRLAVPKGRPIIASNTPLAALDDPTVAVADDGRFAVVWSNYGEDRAGNGRVFFREFDSNGGPLGRAQQVSRPRGTNQHSSVAFTSSGAPVVVWDRKVVGSPVRILGRILEGP